MAASSAAAHSFTIPTVTEGDLRAFHAKHFAGSQAPVNFFTSNDATHEEAEEDEDDGLGYYADGVKRTLTDDQIAMFRHSEIQALLRERRRQFEEEQSETEATTSDVQTSAQLSSQRTAQTSPVVQAKSNGDRSQQSQIPKRRWEEFVVESGADSQPITHRRLARELDENQVTPTDLMYGDEEPVLQPTSNSHSNSGPRQVSSRTLRSYDD